MLKKIPRVEGFNIEGLLAAETGHAVIDSVHVFVFLDKYNISSQYS